MNTTTDTTETPQPPRPFGYWLKAVDRLMAAEFAAAFDDEGITRRDWRLLNVVDGSVERERPLRAHKLRRLIDRGWVVTDGEGWSLTDDGRAAKERLGALVDDIRAKVSDAVSDEDMATTLASLEKIARAFGWDEETPLPRGRGHRFGGHGRGNEHGHGFPGGFDHGRGFGHGHGCEHGRGHGPHGGHHRTERLAQHAFERGFDAGFSRGRDA